MAAAFVYLKIKPVVQPNVIIIGDTVVTVEIADTPVSRAQGLSGRDSLPADQGMYFPLEQSARHSFWMKDMRFPLDIIWIREGKIVDISENVPYPAGDQPPATVQPKEPADAVLEVNAGFTERHGLKIGDEIRMTGGNP